MAPLGGASRVIHQAAFALVDGAIVHRNARSTISMALCLEAVQDEHLGPKSRNLCLSCLLQICKDFSNYSEAEKIC